MSALFQNSVEHNLDRRRRGRSELWSDAPPRMVTRHEGGTECHILLLLREIFESEYKVQLADIFNHKTEEWKKDSAKREFHMKHFFTCFM